MRTGRQTPTQSFILPYTDTKGNIAVKIYNQTNKTAQEWQECLIYDIMAVNDDGLWTHTKFGYSVPRRNGKNELIILRELYALIEGGEKVLHTAHKTTTSHAAWERLRTALQQLGYVEITKKRKDLPEKCFTAFKQFGLENIVIVNGGTGSINFRTRTANGGLGEGYDLLIIDEAQEYTDDQETALKYVVSDSKNPQTIYLGTPPTAVSHGTVFTKYRKKTLQGGRENSGWAEWSMPGLTDCRNKDAWYETNPSLGVIISERSVTDELGEDNIDFNIQRLGVWLEYNQKSEITKQEWLELNLKNISAQRLKGKLFIGIKFGKELPRTSVSIACKMEDKNIFVECLDNRPSKAGVDWIIGILNSLDWAEVVVDGAAGQMELESAMKDAGIRKKPILPTVKEVINANTKFELAIENQTLRHCDQPSVEQAVSNCEKRAIGSNGGFGYKALREEIDISILDSIILALWACENCKTTAKKQKIVC